MRAFLFVGTAAAVNLNANARIGVDKSNSVLRVCNAYVGETDKFASMDVFLVEHGTEGAGIPITDAPLAYPECQQLEVPLAAGDQLRVGHANETLGLFKVSNLKDASGELDLIVSRGHIERIHVRFFFKQVFRMKILDT